MTFKLDGKDVSVLEGTTIWEAAQGQGQLYRICAISRTRYRSDGNCRACMVEIEGERVLAASCIRPVQDGMVVHSSSERTKISALVVELLTADQPKQHMMSRHIF